MAEMLVFITLILLLKETWDVVQGLLLLWFLFLLLLFGRTIPLNVCRQGVKLIATAQSEFILQVLYYSMIVSHIYFEELNWQS